MVKTALETLSPSHPTRQEEDDETNGMSCPWQSLLFIFFSCCLIGQLSWGVRPESSKLPLQSPMTDLKDSSLSPLLQITSFDMLGHADNVLSENSFQGWMGYKLSTPRVGYFFNCCFIPLKRKSKRHQRVREIETAGPQAKLGLWTAQDSEATWIKAVWSVSVLALHRV